MKPVTTKNRSRDTVARAPSVSAEPQVDLPEPDTWTNRRASEQAQRAAQARHESGRRRHVDPTTCERSYSAEELEFMLAMDTYRHENGRPFPTWCEALEVLRGLGYRKTNNLPALPPAAPSPPPAQPR